MIKLTLLLTVLLTALLTALPALPARAEPPAPLLVAAASDLTNCIDELGAAFGKQVPGAELKVSLGASGSFFAQISNGAPFDVFLSADMSYPNQLARHGAADGATLTPYALGRIALWSLDPRFNLKQGLPVLNDARLIHIAIPNPGAAPYGRAAKEALEAAGMWMALRPKLVIRENVGDTMQSVRTGKAQIGIVPYASVLSPQLKGSGSYYLIPEAGLALIEQGAIVTTHGKDNPLAARFVLFLSSPGARAILQRSGYGLPLLPVTPPG
jgi:molybdate transport system substrate-binding protein